MALDWARINGVIYAAEPDGAGGFFVGGAFETVDGAPRQNLVHLLADGSLDPAWGAEANGRVRALTRLGDTLYVGGEFTRIGGTTRRGIAALDPDTGAALPWRSDAGNRVNALAVDGDRLYAGGTATTYGAVERKSLAAFDLVTGRLLDFDAGEVGRVVVLEPSDRGTLFVGGSFIEIGGAERRYLAELDPVTAIATGWHPPGLVPPFFGGLAFDSDRVFVGGEFIGSEDGFPRYYLAALDKATGDLEPWNPSANLWVRDVVYDDGLVYAGGYFGQVAGVPRNGLAAIDAVSGAVDDFPFEITPPGGGNVDDLFVAGDVLYAVGVFEEIGGGPRYGGAAVDLASETLLPWNPDALPIRTVSVEDGVAYIGGAFSNVGGTPQVFAAAVDAQTGALLAWDPSPVGFIEGSLSASGEPDVMLAHAGTVIMGGDFLDCVGGSGHAYLAVIKSLFADGFESGDTTRWSTVQP